MEFKTTKEWVDSVNQLMRDINDLYQIVLDTDKHVLSEEFENIREFIKSAHRELRMIGSAFNRLIRLHYAKVPSHQRTSMLGGDLQTGYLFAESETLMDTKGTHSKYKTHSQLRTQINQILRDVDALHHRFQRTDFPPVVLKSEKRVLNDVQNMLRHFESFIRRVYTETLCRYPKKLVGPIELTILDRKSDGARIVLLGDRHLVETKCPRNSQCKTNVVNYLEEVFRHYLSISIIDHLDFFLEMPFSDVPRGFLANPNTEDLKSIRTEIAEGEFSESYLDSLRIYFIDCFQKLKQQCPFYKKHIIDNSPIIRFHYADTRDGVIHTETKEDSKVVIRELQKFGRLEARDLKQSDLLWAFKFFEKMNRSRENIPFLFHFAKIDKQLRKINNPAITELITKFFIETETEDKTQDEISTVKWAIANLYKNLEQGTPIDERMFNFLRTAMTGGFLACLFDIYVATRIIRHQMKHVIVFAGANHTRRLTKLFLHFGYEITTYRESKNKDSFQCIDMTGVPQPWFSTQHMSIR